MYPLALNAEPGNSYSLLLTQLRLNVALFLQIQIFPGSHPSLQISIPIFSAVFISSTCVTYPAHPNFLDFIMSIISGEE
jgi:hypothetical protein